MPHNIQKLDMKLEANEEGMGSLSSHSVWIKLYKSCFAEFDPFCSLVMSNLRAAFRVFRRFSAGNYDTFFFSFHVLRPLIFESFAASFNLLTLSFRLTFRFHWPARIRYYDEDLWCIFKLEEFAKEKYGQTSSVANIQS